MFKVEKKDGTLVEFSAEKIIVAITKSAQRVMVDLTNEEYLKVVNLVKKMCVDTQQDSVKVVDIHKMVEKALREVNKEVAESYASYRNYKTTFVAMMDNVLKYQQEMMFLGDRSNANTDSSLNVTQATLIGNETLKELYNEFFLTHDEKEACKTGFIYVHDKSRRLISTNCCLFDVKTVLENGVVMSGVHYAEPKYLSTVMGIFKDIVMASGSLQYGQ